MPPVSTKTQRLGIANRGGTWRRAPLLLCTAVFLALAGATTWAWEPCHDEGGTFDEVFGQIAPTAAAPVPIGSLHDILGGRSGLSAGQVVGGLQRRAMHPPAYYVLVSELARVFGTGTLALRFPAYLFGVISLWGIACIARQVVPVRGSGSWAALFFAVSPWFLGITNYARPYALALCTAVGSTAVLLHWISTPRPTHTWAARGAFGLLSVLGLYTIYHYGFVLLWQFALLALVAWLGPPERRWRDLAALAGLGVLIGLAYAPWLPTLRLHLGLTAGEQFYFSREMPTAQWPLAASRLLETFALGRPGLVAAVPHAGLLLSALGGLTAVTFALSLRRRSARPPAAAVRAFWISAPLLPILLTAADLWHGTHTLFVSKLSFGLFPLLVLAVVGAWHAVSDRRLRIAGLAAFATLLSIVSLHNVISLQRDVSDFERIAAYVSQADADSHLVVLSGKERVYLVPLLLVLRDAGVERVRVATANRDELPALVDSSTRDPSLRRISLIGFSLYGGPPEWSLSLLRRMAAMGARRGFDLHEFSRGQTPDASGDARSMTFMRSASVRICSV